MRLRTFKAENMAAAMRLVRAELGADAVIVSSHEPAQGQVEVVAAVDPAPESVLDVLPVSAEPADGFDALQDTLDYHRVPAALAERIADAAAAYSVDDAVLALASALDSQFVFAPLAVGAAERPLLLIGPPGAGKTVTAAKLAARARLAKRTAALITTDSLRTGAREQFAGYGALLGISPRAAGDDSELRAAVAASRSADLALIDTTGVNPFDAADLRRLADIAAASEAEPVLVLPAGMDADECADMAQAFAAFGASRLLVTRLDTARRLGGMLAAAHRAGLRLCDVGIGPHLADGLAPLNPLALARLLTASPADRVASLAAAEPDFAESAP
ncbi:MAG: GTPase [Alphaproteobacteria bacterium]